jgi:hypothetical protein
VQYKNANLVENVNFDPNNRQGTKSFYKKNQEINSGVLKPNNSMDIQFNKQANSWIQKTHYNLGSDFGIKVSFNQAEFRDFGKYGHNEMLKNREFNKSCQKSHQKGNFSISSSQCPISVPAHIRPSFTSNPRAPSPPGFKIGYLSSKPQLKFEAKNFRSSTSHASPSRHNNAKFISNVKLG